MAVAARELAISRHAGSVSAVRQAAERSLDGVVELATTIAEMAAPTKDESRRADLVDSHFREAGLTDVRRDEIHDVVARIPGRTRGKALLLAAHPGRREEGVAHRSTDEVDLEAGRGEPAAELVEHRGEVDQLAHRLLHRRRNGRGSGTTRGRCGHDEPA